MTLKTPIPLAMMTKPPNPASANAEPPHGGSAYSRKNWRPNRLYGIGLIASLYITTLMTDSTHNALVTIMIIIAVLIAVILLGRALGPIGYQYRAYQGASAAELLPRNNRGYGSYDRPQYSQTVTSYSRPSRYVTPTYYSSDVTYHYDTTSYTYECSSDGSYCWTNQ